MTRAQRLARRWMFVVALAVSVVACGGGDSTGSGVDPSESPPITESESGRVVGQPATVEDLLVAVSADGVVTFVVSGTVPSPCHDAVAGFEGPNADGLVVGSAESWLDLDCVVTDEPTPFRLAVPIQGLAGEQCALDIWFDTAAVVALGDPDRYARGFFETTGREAGTGVYTTWIDTGVDRHIADAGFGSPSNTGESSARTSVLSR